MTIIAELTALLASGDFAGVEHVARGAIRRGDPDPVIDALWTWMLDAWREQPVARLAELLSLLGPHRRLSSSGQALLAHTQKNIPDEAWFAVLREGDARDVDALLQTMVRTRNRDVADRFEAFQRAHLDRPDPRIATAFLGWMEAPPFRATSMQPLWLEVFDLLFEQGDPRCVPAFARLVEREFPAGATMKKWMGRAFAREQARWDAREDIEALRFLTTTEAERALGDLDALAAVVAALTGEYVEAGGVLATLDLDRVLAPEAGPGALVSSAFAGGATVCGTHGLENEWDRQVHTASGRVAARRGADLVVFEADGRAVWAGPGRPAFDLSADGRFLALAIGTRVRLIALEDDAVVEVELVGLALHEAFRNGNDVRQSVCFDPEVGTIYACCVAVAPRYSNYEPATLVVALQFDPDPLRLVALEPQFESDAVESPQFERVLSHRGAVAASRRWVVCAVPTESQKSEDIVVLRRLAAGRLAFHTAFAPPESGGKPEMEWDEDQRLVFSTQWYGKPRVTVAVDLNTGFSQVLEPTTPVIHPYARPWVPHLSAARNRDAMLLGTDGRGSPRLCLYLRDEAPISIGIKDPPSALALSPDGQWLVAASSRTIFRHDVVPFTKKGKKPKPGKLKGHKATVTQLLISSDGQHVFSLASDAIMVWDSAGNCVHDLRHAAAPISMAAHPQKQLLASCDARRVYVWDLGLGQEVASLELSGAPSATAWSTDQAAVCVAAPSGDAWQVLQWSPASGAVVTLWQSPSPIVSLASLPECGHLVAGTQEGAVFLLQTDATGAVVATMLTRHIAAPVAMDFDHAGNLIVGAGCFGHTGSVVRLAPAAEQDDVSGSVAPEWPPATAQVSTLSPVAFPTHRYHAAETRVSQGRGEDVSGSQLPEVRVLQLREPVGWEDLTGMPVLEALHIHIYKGWDKLHRSLITARYPAGLHRLTLSVKDTPEYPSLAGTPFTHVTIVGSHNTSCAGLEGVRELAFGFNEKRTSLDDLGCCQRLEQLSMMRPRALTSIEGLASAVQAGSPLRSVSIKECTALRSLAGLQQASALETLEITDAPLEDLSPLTDLPALRVLRLSGLTALDDFGPLASLQLETLSLEGCTQLVDLGVLANSRATLRTLDLIGCAGLRDIGVLDGFPALESVALGGTQVRPGDLTPWLLERAHWFEHPLALNIVTARAEG